MFSGNRRLIAAALYPAFIAGSVVAQDTSAINRGSERLLEQQQQRARERADSFERSRERAPEGKEIPQENAQPEQQDGTQCLPIKELRVLGMTKYKQSVFNNALTPLTGSCVNIASINDALRAITNRYIGDGFITSRALVGEQSLKEGTLTITVVEGRVSAITAQSEGKKSYGKGELATAFPQGAGKILNLRAIEQGVDQLSRMDKASPSIDIAPGSEVGTSEVIVKRNPGSNWLRPTVMLDNDGNNRIGRRQATAIIDADSVLGLGDVWSLYYQQSLSGQSDRLSRAFGGFASLPYGWWTLSLSAGRSNYRSILQGDGFTARTSGRTWNSSASLDRMMFRDAKNTLVLSGSLSMTDTANFIETVRLESSSYRIISAKLGARWQRRMGRSQLRLSGNYERGLDILGAKHFDTGPGGATGTFNLFETDAMLISPFAIGPTNLNNTLIVRGQWALDNLFAAQRLSIGGPSTVRGFNDDGISGRSGFTVRDQINFAILEVANKSPTWRTSLTGFLGYDLGVIKPQNNEPYERGTIHSAVAGVRAQSRHLYGEIGVALPVSAPSFVQHDDARVSASIRLMM